MKAWLRMVGGHCKAFWWVIVLILAVVLFLCGGFIFTGRKRRRKPGQVETDVQESFVKAATNRVAVAVTDVKVDRAIIKTKSEVKRQELEEIRKEPDGKKRRERLASVLRKSL